MKAPALIWLAAPGASFEVETALRFLTEEERDQLAGFKATGPARAFAFRRAARRVFLAREFGADPPTLEIVETEGAGPRLSPPFDHWSISASSAGANIVVAAARTPFLGIDAENTRRSFNAGALSKRLFSAADEKVWRKGDRENVLALWCAKEAVIKATGGGLTLDRLAEIEVHDASPNGWRPVRGPNGALCAKIITQIDGMLIAIAASEPLSIRFVDGAPILGAAGIDAAPIRPV